MTDDAQGPARQSLVSSTEEKAPLDRRELIKKLGKTAALPLVVTTFVASDVTEAEAAS